MPHRVSQYPSNIDVSGTTGLQKFFQFLNAGFFLHADSLWGTDHIRFDMNPRDSVTCVYPVDFESRSRREIWGTEANGWNANACRIAWLTRSASGESFESV
jgi:hypothetical protein